MTMLDSPIVSVGPDGSVSVDPGPVPRVGAPQFRADVTLAPAQPVPAAEGGAVPPISPAAAVPCPAGWTAWFEVEFDGGTGWETASVGRAPISAGTQRALDDLVDCKLGAGAVGRYGVVRVSAVSVDSRGRSLVSYREASLPLRHRSDQAAASAATA